MGVPPAIVYGHGGDEGQDVEDEEDGNNPGVGSSFTAARLEEWGFVLLLFFGLSESAQGEICDCELFFLIGRFDFDLKWAFWWS